MDAFSDSPIIPPHLPASADLSASLDFTIYNAIALA